MAGKKRSRNAASKRRRAPYADMEPLELPSGEVISPEEVFRQINEMLRDIPPRIDIHAGRPLTAAEQALDRAEEMATEAFDLDDDGARALAREALTVSPDSATAYLLLADLSADPTAAEGYLRQGIAAGERALGEKVLQPFMGELGRIVEARGYLLCLRSLINCLDTAGRAAEAIEICERLALLDTNDSYPSRFHHLDLLIMQRRLDDARRLIATHADEPLAAWQYGRALVEFADKGATPDAARFLTAAMRANPHVPGILLSGREFSPDDLGIPTSDEDEAKHYANDFRRCWMDVPDSLAWLRAAADVPLHVPARERTAAWSEVKRVIAGLPLARNEEWEIDLAEDETGSWTFMIVSGDLDEMLHVDVWADRPDPEELWSIVVNTMRRPRSGEPRRPASVAMRPGALPKTWRGRLRQVGVATHYRPTLDHVDALASYVDGRIAEAQSAHQADREDPLAATRLLLTEARDLPANDDEVWEADVRRAPAWVTGEGQPYRPWISLAASRGRDAGLYPDISPERPDAATVVRVVLRAASEVGYRPARVEVGCDDLVDGMHGLLEPLGIEVCRAPAGLPTIDRIVESFADTMAAPDALSPLVNVPGVTVDAGRAFYSAAADFYRARPWRRLPGDMAIIVRQPSPACRLVHAVVMGQSGMQQGVAVYEDLAALDIARSGDFAAAGGTTSMSVMFGEEFEVQALDHDWIEREGFDIAGACAWPLAVRMNPGFAMRPPLAWELELLTGCLRDIPAFLEALPAPGFGSTPRTASPTSWTSPSGWTLSWA